MTISLRFKLIVESDWHINAGYGLGSQINAILERDGAGNPIISGSTLKGLFRDALYDLGHIIMSENAAYDAVSIGETPKEFGIAGRILGYEGIESRWTFSAATPLNASGGKVAGVDGAMVATGVRVDPALRRAEANKFYTREMGAAQTFDFTLSTEYDDSTVEDDALWLVAAASYIRRLGGRRRRGAGQCQIQLQDTETHTDLHQKLLANFGATYCKQGQVQQVQLPDTTRQNDAPDETPVQRFRIWLHAKRPIVISNHHEAGNTYQGRMDVPGRTLRGALAYAVAPSKRNDDVFRQLFVLGGLGFTDLHPFVRGKDAVALSVESPLGLQQQEGNPDDYHSVMVNPPLKTKGYKGRHLLTEGYPSARSLDDAKIESETHMHVQIAPQTKRAMGGNLYAYETPPSYLLYVGEITLRDDVSWQQFAALTGIHLSERFELRIGKGRRRSYGTCTAYIEPLADSDPPTWMPLPFDMRLKASSTQQANMLTLTLASDTIVTDIWGRYVQNFKTDAWLTKELGIYDKDKDQRNQNYEIIREIVRTKVIKGFDMRAGLPHWQDIALIAGSSVTIQLKSGTWNVGKLQEMERNGIGLRRSEGYGRVVINHPAHSGVVEGFTTLKIPDALLTAAEQTVQTQLLRSKFYETWRNELEAALPKSYRDKEAQTMLALSRLLVQHADDTQLTNRINLFGVSDATPDKDARLSNESKEALNALINKLDTEYAEHKRQGVILLAEALAQRSNS